MKTRPILFSTYMVKAILDGRKTQTRRIIKPQPTDIWIEDCRNQSSDLSMFDKKGRQIFWIENSVKNGEVKPKAKPCDVLWVRETWTENGLGYYRYKADGWKDGKGPFTSMAVPERFRNKWKPSIHMPKEASRLFLKVINVRVERLQDISPKDAIAEGILPITAHNDSNRILGWHDYMVNPKDGFNTYFDPRESFFSLWESIHGKESLEYNPWVWVYDFERIERVEVFNLFMEAVNGVRT
ncbi:hypothetical protein [Flagellimonas sp.]|uniref:hypothetical protein n=1 Tax=Flagellimonas sp. TaxID=2058762 RepID=UPI003BA9B9EB